MRKIIIKVPTIDKPKWEVALGSGHFKRVSIAHVIALARRLIKRCLASSEEGKTSVKVKYDHDTANETLPSFNPQYLAYAVTCFLEDYLAPQTLRDAEKVWLKYLEKGAVEC